MLLIDGYNLLFAAGPVADIRAAREELVARLESWCARTNRRARVFFDSREGPLRGGTSRVQVHFVAAGTTADDAIAETVAATNDRTAFRVVSSDRAVADAARRRKMEVCSSADFLRELAGPATEAPTPPEKRDGISEAEAKAWMRTFGFGEEPHETR